MKHTLSCKVETKHTPKFSIHTYYVHVQPCMGGGGGGCLLLKQFSHLPPHHHHTHTHQTHTHTHTSFIHLDELQFQVLWHRMVLAHTKYVSDDVMRGIPLVPQSLKDLICLIDFRIDTMCKHLFNQERVGLITHLHGEYDGFGMNCQ